MLRGVLRNWSTSSPGVLDLPGPASQSQKPRLPPRSTTVTAGTLGFVTAWSAVISGAPRYPCSLPRILCSAGGTQSPIRIDFCWCSGDTQRPSVGGKQHPAFTFCPSLIGAAQTEMGQEDGEGHSLTCRTRGYFTEQDYRGSCTMQTLEPSHIWE